MAELEAAKRVDDKIRLRDAAETAWNAMVQATNNAIERFNGECRRRVKTQGLCPMPKPLSCFCSGCLQASQIQMRRIDPYAATSSPS